MNIVENVEKIMKKKNITAYQLERDIGISQTTFSNWRKGRQPSVDKIAKILPYLEVTPNEVFGYEPTASLTENERELLELFRQLPDREQIKYIGRLEDAVEKYNTKE